MKNKLLKIIIIGILGINLTYAYSVNQNAVVSINDCTVNCIALDVPDDINIGQEIFLSPSGQNYYLSFNPLIGEKVTVYDYRNGGNEWSLGVQSSNFLSADTLYKIPFSNIGITTYTNSNTYTTDSNHTPPTGTTAPLHQSINYNDFVTNNLSDSNFEFFTGTNPTTSDEKTIMTATNAPRTEQNSVNLGMLIKFPASPEQTLSNDNYNLDLTFTLTIL